MEIKTMKRVLGLSDPELDKIKNMMDNLTAIAELSGADVFLDAMDLEQNKMVVLGQASSLLITSTYQGNIVGCYAEREDEPAIYHAYAAGIPVRDTKAVTQESRIVLQNVVPVKNAEGRTIAVLISERDISEDVRKNKRYDLLSHAYETMQERQSPDGGSQKKETMQELNQSDARELGRREGSRRLRDSLQTISSIMNLELRQSLCEETKTVLRDNISRIMSISAISEQLQPGTESGGSNGHVVECQALLQKLKGEIQNLYGRSDIELTVYGDRLELEFDQAVSVSMAVNEILSVVYKRSFAKKEAEKTGHIRVELKKGEAFGAILISDDGDGTAVAAAEAESDMSMTLISLLVTEKLKGQVYLPQTDSGTVFQMEFPVKNSSKIECENA